MSTTTRPVLVVGAGFAGVAAARALSAAGLPYEIVERAPEVGGIWRSDTDGPAYTALIANTTRATTGYPDMPLISRRRFPSRVEVHNHVRAYTDLHGLRRHLRLNTEVTAAAPASDGTWLATTRDLVTGAEWTGRYRAVIVAAGTCWEPNVPDVAGADTLTPAPIHSHRYVNPTPYSGQRVLVVGIGHTGAEIATGLLDTARHVAISARRAPHFVPHRLLGVPIDVISASWWWHRLPDQAAANLFRFLRLLNPSDRHRRALERHRRPDDPIFARPVTISTRLPAAIHAGRIQLHPELAHVADGRARFTDGTSTPVDRIIWCTGYRISHPWLPAPYTGSEPLALYRHVVAAEHPGLFFIGYSRPSGARTHIAAAQADWIIGILTGCAALPDLDHMRAEATTGHGVIYRRYLDQLRTLAATQRSTPPQRVAERYAWIADR